MGTNGAWGSTVPYSPPPPLHVQLAALDFGQNTPALQNTIPWPSTQDPATGAYLLDTRVASITPAHLPPWFPPALLLIIQDCLAYAPTRRPTMECLAVRLRGLWTAPPQLAAQMGYY